MRTLRSFVAALALLAICASPAFAGKSEGIFYYIPPGSIDLTALLAGPPNTNSAMERYDEKKVQEVLGARTPQDMIQASADSKRNIFIYADVLGPNFAAANLPLAQALFKHANSDTEILVEQAKDYFLRPRPAGAPQTHGSYPSGHAAFAAMSAIVLSEMIPEKRGIIFARAAVFAESRIVAGVHYPSDVQAGWISGTVVASDLLMQPKFQSDLVAARAEVRHVLGMP